MTKSRYARMTKAFIADAKYVIAAIAESEKRRSKNKKRHYYYEFRKKRAP